MGGVGAGPRTSPGDYEQVLAFQGIIVVMCLLSSVVLFGLLLMLIHRAERVLAERMHRNRLLENELHSNEKLAGTGRVIASIAHEIRNPLGIIRSSAELLQRRTDKPIRARRAFWEPFTTNPYAFPRRSMIFWTTPGRASPARIWWM